MDYKPIEDKHYGEEDGKVYGVEEHFF